MTDLCSFRSLKPSNTDAAVATTATSEQACAETADSNVMHIWNSNTNTCKSTFYTAPNTLTPGYVSYSAACRYPANRALCEYVEFDEDGVCRCEFSSLGAPVERIRSQLTPSRALSVFDSDQPCTPLAVAP